MDDSICVEIEDEPQDDVSGSELEETVSLFAPYKSLECAIKKIFTSKKLKTHNQ